MSRTVAPPPERSPDRSPDFAVEAPGAVEVGTVPWPLLLRRRMVDKVERSDNYRWIVLATALSGLLTVSASITILAVSIPSIAVDLDSTETTLTWLITGPTLAFAVVGPSVGKLGDLYGHRPVYLIGLAGAMVFAGLSALAWSAPTLIATRVMGATLGAATGPSSMAMINSVFRPHERAQAMGYWALVMAGGPVMGVVIGGPVVEAFGWRWIFVAQVPLALAGLLIAIAILPATARVAEAKFDITGSVLLATAVIIALLSLNRGPDAGWSDPTVVGGFILAPVVLAVFVAVERRVAHPLIPLEYFRRRNFAFPIGVQVFSQFAYMGGFILTPLLLQNVLGYGETKAGLLSISRPLTFAVAGPIAGYLAVKVGERSAAVVGTTAVVVSMLGLAQVGPGTSDVFIVVVLALSGVGLGASLPVMSATIANAVEDHDLGVAGAAQQMMAELGLVAGIQIMLTVQASRATTVGLAQSYSDAYLVGAAVASLAIVCAAMVRNTMSEPTMSPDTVHADGRSDAPTR